ncbi:MAG TPA: hypothetical protein VMN39_10315 [Longimicrobiaceae bacterium]|nr:hypothetical protein [Longimicrobiaceae bacterium]
MQIPPRAAALLLAWPFASACTEASGDAAQPVVRDSAGITIVENPAPGAADAPLWRVPEEPSVAIGTAEGPPETQLFRVTSVRRAPDGTVIVSNTGTNEVRLYGPDGAHLASLGREGDGPGEFRMVYGAWPWAGDSVLAFDMAQRRLQVFDRAGVAGRSLSLSSGGPAEALAGVLADGTLVTYSTHRSAPGMERHVQSHLYLHRSASGELLDSIGSLEWLTITPRQVGEGVFMMGAPIFSPAGQSAVGADHIYLSSAREPAVEVRDPTGRLVRIVRWPDQDRRVTQADREAYRRGRLAMEETEDERRGIESMIDGSEWSETLPTLAGLRSDPGGGFWVRLYQRVGQDDPPLWWTFGGDGVFQGTVHLPEDFELHEIGSDYLLGLARDELGVAQVRVYPRESR